jgi:hypothetical protein
MNAVEIDGARLTGIVQQLVRAPSCQTDLTTSGCRSRTS